MIRTFFIYWYSPEPDGTHGTHQRQIHSRCNLSRTAGWSNQNAR